MKNKVYKTAEELYLIAKEQKIKHKFKIHRREKVLYINEDPVISINYHFYKDALKTAGKTHLIHKWRLDDAIYDIKKCSEISEYAFMNGFDDYYFLVGIQTLYGWKKFDDMDAVRQKIKDWVQNDFKPNLRGDNKLFLVKFRAKIRQILRKNKSPQEQEVTAREFVSNIANTGTSGSAFDPGGPKLEVEIDDLKIKVPNNKYAKSGALSEEEKYKRLMKMETGKASVALKTEFYPKVRLIISSSYNMTMKMRFIDTWLKKWMHGSTFSTLFQTKNQTFQMWCEFAKENGWNLPIDQFKFDHNVSKDMVLIILDEITNLIRDFCPNNSELLEVMATITFGIMNTTVFWKHDQKTESFTYLSGILSGWQWTALFDSLANMAEVLIAIDSVTDRKIKVDILQLNVQGDDVALKTKKLIQCLGIVLELRSMGFQIHPSKTFFSKHHNEYLRKYYYKNSINGYPARMINGLLWVYPGEDLSLTTIEKLSSTFSKWEKLGERLKVKTKDMLKYMMADYRGLKMKNETVENYLQCSILYGGAGIKHKKGKKSIVLETKTEEEMGRIGIDDVGYKEFALRYGEYQSRELKMWFIKSIGIRSKLKDLKVEESKEYNVIKEDPKPYKFNMLPSVPLPKTYYNEKFPKNVIFGKSHDLLQTAYPYIDTFVQQARAPKGWVYDYLSGKIKSVTPRISKMSTEFSSMLWSIYEPSLINAMYHKTCIEDKWNSLQQYALENFEIAMDRIIETLPSMF